MTTVTIWIPKSDLENFLFIEEKQRMNLYWDSFDLEERPFTIYTEPRHVETLQLNVSLDLFVKLNLK